MSDGNQRHDGGALPASGATPMASQPLDGAGLSLVRNIEVELTLEIGRRKMRIADLVRLSEGQTVELTKAAGEPLDLYVNGRLLGRGEACVIGDHYAVRITEISPLESADR